MVAYDFFFFVFCLKSEVIKSVEPDRLCLFPGSAISGCETLDLSLPQIPHLLNEMIAVPSSQGACED